MNKRVLVTAPPILPSLDNYLSIFAKHNVEVVTPDFNVKECLSEDDLHRLLKDIDGILCGDDKLTANVLKNAPRLKVISKWGTGIDSIDARAAKELGIKLHRVTGVFADPVADTILAYILAFSRKIFEKDSLIRDGKWHKVTSYTLREQCLGVLGAGHIGQGVIERASAFGMNILCWDIKTLPTEFLKKTNARQVSLDEVLSHADFLSLNCDANSETRHLINQNTLAKMKPNAVIINTARGALIDEAALIEALSKKIIAGAALDVFEKEPLPEHSPLRKMENVMLSPHNANGSPAVFRNVDLAAIENLLSELTVESK